MIGSKAMTFAFRQQHTHESDEEDAIAQGAPRPLLGQHDVSSFQQSGYLVLDHLFSVAEVLHMQRAADYWVLRLPRQKVAHSDGEDGRVGPHMVSVVEGCGDGRMRRVERVAMPHLHKPEIFESMLRDERICAVLRELLGPHLILEYGELRLTHKCERRGSRAVVDVGMDEEEDYGHHDGQQDDGTTTAFRQDFAHFAYTNDSCVTIWVPLQDLEAREVDGEMVAGVSVLAGSHRGGIFTRGWQRNVAEDDDVGERQESCLSLHTGCAYIFHNRLRMREPPHHEDCPFTSLRWVVRAADAWPLAGNARHQKYDKKWFFLSGGPQPARWSAIPAFFPPEP